VPLNPSAYVGHENQISDPLALSVAWLGNLNYWLVMMLLDSGYRYNSANHIETAKMLMMGPVWALCRYLPTRGSGMPFDQLNLGLYTGLDRNRNAKFVLSLTREIEALEARLKSDLPAEYPTGYSAQVKSVVEVKSAAN
jgi:hypothetical protein